MHPSQTTMVEPRAKVSARCNAGDPIRPIVICDVMSSPRALYCKRPEETVEEKKNERES